MRLGDHQAGDRTSDWHRFVDLYAPLVHRWANQQGLQLADAQDLVQEVMASMHRFLPSFRYDPTKSFRGYLYRVTKNKLHDLRAKQVRQLDDVNQATLAQEDPALGVFERQEYNSYISYHSLKLIVRDFPQTQWRACWMQVVEGRTAGEAAKSLGITKNMAYLARSRVLARLRTELVGMLDSENESQIS